MPCVLIFFWYRLTQVCVYVFSFCESEVQILGSVFELTVSNIKQLENA